MSLHLNRLDGAMGCLFFPVTRSGNINCIAIILLSGDIALNTGSLHDSTFVPTSQSSHVRTDRDESASDNSNMSMPETLVSDFKNLGHELKLAHLNVRSIIKHIDELKLLLQDKPFDILSVSETWLNENIIDGEVVQQ